MGISRWNGPLGEHWQELAEEEEEEAGLASREAASVRGLKTSSLKSDTLVAYGLIH